MLAVTEDEQSDEVSMATVIELCGSGGITDETLVYTDDIEMDGWMPFGEVKESLDWDSGEEDGEDAGAFTSLFYQITEDEQSDECDMHEVMRLINDGVITDETMVWAEGLDGWVAFEEAKYYCEWPDDDEASIGGPPETVYYESAPDESEEVPFDDFKLLVEGGLVNDETKVWAEGLSGVRADSTHPNLRCEHLLYVHVHVRLRCEWLLDAVDAFGRSKGGPRS